MEFNTLDVQGFDSAMRGMRNPLKSYDKADTVKNNITGSITIGPNDYKLAKSLWKGGTEHRKWMRQVIVWVEITAPRYWWSEFDTYKIGTSANSESTMHTILKENFNQSQFEWPKFNGSDRDIETALNDYIDIIKTVRDRANKLTGQDKEHYQQILKGMLPESFLQKRTICLNYEVLATMYRQRKNHRLPQWSKDFVSWIKSLPYNEFITGDFND
jgi:hypothetical protein